MIRTQKGFTLIELLVVIAIIGILATLVITQLGGARVKARNATAKSDISEAGKAIEVFKNDDSSNQGALVVDSSYATGVQSSVTESGTFTKLNYIFSGTQTFVPGGATAYSGAISSYALKLLKSPSANQSYSYYTFNGAQTASNLGTMTAKCYAIGSTVDSSNGVTDKSVWVVNGQSIQGISASDVTPGTGVIATC